MFLISYFDHICFIFLDCNGPKPTSDSFSFNKIDVCISRSNLMCLNLPMHVRKSHLLEVKCDRFNKFFPLSCPCDWGNNSFSQKIIF